jgi:hypothetical protein
MRTEKTNIQLTPAEFKRITELLNTAENTPVIAATVQDGLEGRDFASMAYNDLYAYQEELGKKYNYDPKTHGIGVNGIVMKVIEE